MKWIAERAGEPSSWAGFAAIMPMIVTVMSGGASPELIGAIAAGIASIFMRERGRGA